MYICNAFTHLTTFDKYKAHWFYSLEDFCRLLRFQINIIFSLKVWYEIIINIDIIISMQENMIFILGISF